MADLHKTCENEGCIPTPTAHFWPFDHTEQHLGDKDHGAIAKKPVYISREGSRKPEIIWTSNYNSGYKIFYICSQLSDMKSVTPKCKVFVL